MTKTRRKLAAIAATVAGLAAAGAFAAATVDSALASGDDVGKSAIAAGATGARVALSVDGATGKIVRREYDDSERDD